jgi:hypothetical protein
MRIKLNGLASGLLACASLIALPSAALATNGTAAIAGNTLSMTQPTTVAFSATLTGVDQTATSSQAFAVSDQTGSGSGWNITATSTTFTTAGGKTLPDPAVTVQSAPTVACDLSTTCTLATTNVSFPYTLPAATVAPTATKLFNATAGTGLGNQTASTTMRLAIPASVTAGSYTSTWTYSLVSAP